MNQVQIGKFIAAERKQKGYTQRQLADRLGISDKTISKWETGKGFPEMSLMLPLCECLGITVNELLSGERLSDSEYKQKAEEKLVNMIKERDANRKAYRLTNIAGLMSSVIFVTLMVLVCVYAGTIPLTLTIILTVLAIGEFAAGLYVATLGEQSIGYYQCPECGEYFIPTYREYLMGIHIGSIRRLSCPHCCRKVWAKKVMSRDE